MGHNWCSHILIQFEILLLWAIDAYCSRFEDYDILWHVIKFICVNLSDSASSKIISPEQINKKTLKFTKHHSIKGLTLGIHKYIFTVLFRIFNYESLHENQKSKLCLNRYPMWISEIIKPFVWKKKNRTSEIS